MIRTLWVFGAGFALTVYYGTRIMMASALKSPTLECTCRELPAAWCRGLLRLAGVRVEMEGLEHLGRNRPQVLVSNHESWFDVFALAGHLPVDYRFVAKQELRSIPFFGPSWVACGHISIDRQDRDRALASMEHAARLIHDSGATIVIFPEGTRSATGELRPFKKGAFVLALQARVPVVPVAVLGSRSIMAKGSWRVRPGTVRVRIGEPIPVEGMDHPDRDRLLNEARDAVAALRGGEGPTDRLPGAVQEEVERSTPPVPPDPPPDQA